MRKNSSSMNSPPHNAICQDVLSALRLARAHLLQTQTVLDSLQPNEFPQFANFVQSASTERRQKAPLDMPTAPPASSGHVEWDQKQILPSLS